MDLETGKIVWQEPYPFGNLILVADKLLMISQMGEIAWGTFEGNRYREQFREKRLKGGRGEGKDGP